MDGAVNPDRTGTCIVKLLQPCDGFVHYSCLAANLLRSHTGDTTMPRYRSPSRIDSPFFERTNDCRILSCDCERCGEPVASFKSCELETADCRARRSAELVRDSPVVAHADLRLHPDQTRFVAEALRSKDIEGFLKKSVRRPQMQMRVIGDQLSDWLTSNRRQRHRAVVVLCRSPRRRV